MRDRAGAGKAGVRHRAWSLGLGDLRDRIESVRSRTRGAEGPEDWEFGIVR